MSDSAVIVEPTQEEVLIAIQAFQANLPPIEDTIQQLSQARAHQYAQRSLGTPGIIGYTVVGGFVLGLYGWGTVVLFGIHPVLGIIGGLITVSTAYALVAGAVTLF